MNYDVDIIVIGGGASGLAAAITAARNKSRVLIIERMNRLGKKLLATGNGKCNYTNTETGAGSYYSSDIIFCETVLKAFSYEHTIKFFKDLGVWPRYKQNYVYPHSEQALALVEALMMETQRLNIQVITDEEITSIKKSSGYFAAKSSKHTFNCSKVILAAGGKASEKLGSNGSGYALARMLGHSIIAVQPALGALRCKGNFSGLAGVRTEAKLDLYIDNHHTCREHGELQLTNYGISGIPTFQLSRIAAYGLLAKRDVKVNIDFAPDLSFGEISSYIRNQIGSMPDKPISMLFNGLINHKISAALNQKLSFKEKDKISRMTSKEIKSLITLLKCYPVEVIKTNGFENAQASAGGVDTNEINPYTMESKICKDLYITGEIIDVDGRCGGYNLQWAWATGCIAGRHVSENR